MTTVPDKVLRWLYSVLGNEYHDPNRTYAAVAEALSNYPSLSPRTEIYTYESGHTALLLLLSGTLPVQFRGTTYRFPIAVWVPHAYPREGPIVFVTPAKGMLVRAGQHVAADGRVYHPYLAGWAGFWDKSSINDFFTVLRGVFAKEPPVIAEQAAQGQAPPAQAAPPPRPPPPEERRPPQTASPAQAFSPSQAGPPPLPPKPGERGSQGSPYPGSASSQNGPPLPPLLPAQSSNHGYGSQQLASPPPPARPPHHLMTNHPLRQSSLDSAPSPYTGQQPFSTDRSQASYQQYQSPVSPIAPADPTVQQQRQQQQPQHYQSPPPFSNQYGAPTYAQGQPHYAQQPPQQQYPPQQYQQPHPQGYMQSPPPQHLQQQPPQPPAPKQPAPDLLSSPLDVTLPSQTNPASTSIPVPPVPPNPQKDALLTTLSQTLTAQIRSSLSSNHAAISPLQAQQSALRQAHAALSHELASLRDLDAALASNERILHETMARADGIVRAAAGAERPDIDALLVCPTVAGGQLYGLVGEARACVDTRGALVRGLDAGRVGADVFVRTYRSVAREEFLRKALAGKVAKGMGLEVGGV